MKTVLRLLGTFNWITPALHLAGAATGQTATLTYPVGMRFRSGAEIVKMLRAHGIHIHLLTRAQSGDRYVFTVSPDDADQARRLLERY